MAGISRDVRSRGERYEADGGRVMLANFGWFGLLVVILVFGGYLVGVGLVEGISMQLRSIRFIKSLHLVVFVVVSGLLALFLYEVIVGRITFISWITVAVFMAEGVVLIVNGWRCPLTAIAENLGSAHGQVTDILLPKWFADRVWVIYSWLFAGALIGLVWRVLT